MSFTSESKSANPYQYKPIEDVERFERYQPGGYHPMNIGDNLSGRYKIIQKLGHGTFSTTWLARDEQSQQCVAVKIGTADSNPREFHILSALGRHLTTAASEPIKTLMPSPIDNFTIRGPNGIHPCYVTAVARCSVSAAKAASFCRLFQLETCRAIIAQLTLAVGFIHAHGFVHGDLHLGNVLLLLPPSFNDLSDDQINEEYGDPQLEPVVRFDGQPLPAGVPTHGVMPIWLAEASEDIPPTEACIWLSDFGEAFSPSQESRVESHAPLAIRCPEAFFEPTKPLTFASDIWTLACSIWDVMSQRPLFDGFLASQDDIISENVDAVGILPPQWWTKWEARHRWFTEDGRPVEDRTRRAESLEELFEGGIQAPRKDKNMPLMSDEEKRDFLAMIRQTLRHNPEDRISAAQILESQWMVKWGLPEYVKIQK